MQFYADAELSPRQALLPSGTLWIRDQTIARVGEQQYHWSEIGADADDADANGMVHVQRDPSEVFSERAMTSFEGAPITLGHPREDVSSSNWKALSVGHLQGVHQQGDVLAGDLLVHDQRAIHCIRDLGWRGISLGYAADYQPAGRGRMRQVDIVGNHLAILPPDQPPRCGDLCMIGDRAYRKGNTMKRTRDIETTPRTSGNTTTIMGTLDPKQPPPVGPEIVMELPGPASAYGILSDASGHTWLIRHASIGNMVEGQEPVQIRAADRAAMSQHYRAMTASRDRATHNKLEAINKANRAFWHA